MSRAYILGIAHKTCPYCKATGHTKYDCEHVRNKITYIKEQIDVCKSDPTRAIPRLENLFASIPLNELCLLILNIWAYRANHVTTVVKNLVRNGYFNDTEAKMRYKKDKIKLLMWHYWFSALPPPPPKKKINITAIISVEPDVIEVDCPICVECKPASEKIVTNCNHCICKTCMDTYLNHQITTLNFPKPLCVLCRTTITTMTFNNIPYMTELSTKYL